MLLSAITWGSSFANTLEVGYLDYLTSWSDPAPGSEWADVPSGAEDSWLSGHWYYVSGVVRWIPTTNETSPFNRTGWDGTTGFRAFLEYARTKADIRFIPDRGTPGTYVTSKLAAPLNGEPGIEPGGTRTIQLVLRNPTTPYDGL